ncbi:MAG: hypothetical protein SFU56_13365 [Capsulimonadales bacterium]|nr:hypothetical protein [Capsulimonadales bacterium]
MAKEPPVAPRPVFVRLAPLVAAHPLQAEVERLRQLEARLRDERSETAEPRLAEFVLPPLPAGPVTTPYLSSLAARQEAHFDRLQRNAENQRNAFLTEYRDRERRLAEQRETEKRAELIAASLQREESQRQEIIDETVARLRGAVSTDVATVRSRLAVLNGQLRNPAVPLVVLDRRTPRTPAFDEEAERIVQEEIALLERNPEAYGVSMRARLEKKYQTQDALLLELTAKLDRIRQEGDRLLAELSERNRAIREAAIREFLRESVTDTDLPNRLIRQERAIPEAIAFERSNTRATVRAAQESGQGAETLRFAGPAGGPTPATLLAQNATAAADRLADQRRRLEATILRAVRGRVLDMAATRYPDIVLVRTVAPGNPPAEIIGRTDVTDRFLSEMKPGQLPGVPSGVSRPSL